MRLCTGQAFAASERRRARGLHLPSEPGTALGSAFTKGTKGYLVTLKVITLNPRVSARTVPALEGFGSKQGFLKAILVFGACFWKRAPPFGLELVLGKIWVSQGPNGQFELQIAQIWLQKAPWPGFGPKGPLPKVSGSKSSSQGFQKQMSIASWQTQITQIWLQKAPG